MSIIWHRLTAEDMPLYNKYYSMVRTQITDLTFHCRFAWDNVFKIEWAVIEDCLVQISDGGGFTAPFMMMPLGVLNPGKAEKIIREVISVFDSRGWKFRVRAIEESEKHVFEQMTIPVKISYDDDFSDYFYDAGSLRTLPGKKYSKKRNHWSRFLRMYPDYQYRSLEPGLFDGCLALVRKWASGKGIDIADANESDYYMIKRIFDNWDRLQARGGAVIIDGTVAAFAIGSVGRPDVGFLHFEKADIQYDGLYTAVDKLVMENEFPDVRYINREEDIGLPGLRKSKESYFPVCKIRKYGFDLPS